MGTGLVRADVCGDGRLGVGCGKVVFGADESLVAKRVEVLDGGWV